MALLISCGSCQRRINVKDELAGRRVKCPGCGVTLAVPLPTAAPEAPGEPSEEPAESPAARPRKRLKRRKSGGRRSAQPLFNALGIDFTPVKLIATGGMVLVAIVGITLLFTLSPLASIFSSTPEAQAVDLFTAVNGFRDTGLGERVLQPSSVAYTIPGRKKVIVTRPNPAGDFLMVTVKVASSEIAEYFKDARGPISLMTLTADHIQLRAGGESLRAMFVLDTNKSGERGYHFGYTPPKQEGRTDSLLDHLGPGKGSSSTWTHEGTLQELGSSLIFEGARGMVVKIQVGDERLDGSQDRNPLGEVTSVRPPAGAGAGLVSGPDSYVFVTWNKGSTGWMLNDDIEQPNDISLTWHMVCFFPRPKAGTKDMTLIVLGKPRPLRLR